MPHNNLVFRFPCARFWDNSDQARVSASQAFSHRPDHAPESTAMPTETPPEFALSFTTEAVLLLRRQGDEWVEQARADFDDPDLRNALNGLRARAEAASPGGFSTRLMIPDDQILYTTLEIDPGLPREQAVA